MTQYLYPQNLKATANLWLWGLRDFCILGIAALLSMVALVQLGFFLPAAATLCFGFLTIRMDDTSFVILYAQNGEHFDMQKIGKLDSGADLFNGIGDIDVTISLAE